MSKKILIIILFGLIMLSAIIALVLGNKGGPIRVPVGKGVSLSNLLSQARSNEMESNLLEAKYIYQKIINEFPNSSEVMNWQKKLEDINIKLLFSQVLTPKSALYEIKP